MCRPLKQHRHSHREAGLAFKTANIVKLPKSSENLSNPSGIILSCNKQYFGAALILPDTPFHVSGTQFALHF